MLVLKFDLDGNLISGATSTTWGGWSYDAAYDLAFDSKGNLYVVGESYSFANEVVLLKFRAGGGSPTTVSYKGPATYDAGYSLTIDQDDNVIIAGISWDYSVNPNHNSILLLKYGADGQLDWAQNWITASGDDESWSFRSLTTDSSRNIYITGQHAAQCLTSDFSQCNFDALLLKLDSNGNFQWARSWGGVTYDTADSVALDSNGHILVFSYQDAYGASPILSVRSYDVDGAALTDMVLEQSHMSPGFPGAAMVLDATNNIYIADATENHNGVWVSVTPGTSNLLGNQLISFSHSIGDPVSSMSKLTEPSVTQSGEVVDTGGGGADVFICKIGSGNCIADANKTSIDFSDSCSQFYMPHLGQNNLIMQQVLKLHAPRPLMTVIYGLPQPTWLGIPTPAGKHHGLRNVSLKMG
jgi:hypothetical protein